MKTHFFTDGRPWRRGALALLAVSALALSACSGSTAPAGDVERPAPGPPEAVSEEQWAEVVAAAETEGEVIVYSSLGGTEKSFTEFSKAYPEITVRVESAGTADLVARLDQEISVGATGADVTFHVDSLWFDSMEKEDQLAALMVSPEQQKEGWIELVGDRTFAEAYAYPFLIAYNSDTAAPITSVEDILNNAGDARVVVPTPTLSVATLNQYEVWRDVYGDDFIERLSELNSTPEASIPTMSQALAAGEYDYALGIIGAILQPLKDDGAAVEMVTPSEAVTGPTYSLGVLENAGNPFAAQVFANWLMSTEGQQLMLDKHPPASGPLNLDGAIPWGEIATHNPSDWPKDKWDAWLVEEWTPWFG